MKLKRINCDSAVFFGIMVFVLYLVLGIFQFFAVLTVSDADIAAIPELGLFVNNFSAINSLLAIPLVAGVVGYLFTLLAILIYNSLAQRYPISWKVEK